MDIRVVYIILFIAFLYSTLTLNHVVIGLIVIVGIVGFFWWVEKQSIEQKTKLLLDCIDKHKDILIRKARQTMYVDDYGNLSLQRWESERNYFIENILAKECPNECASADRNRINQVLDAIFADEYLRCKSHSDGMDTDQDVEKMSPIEFEYFCAELLEESGWEAHTTKASGDQGIDIIAKIDDVKAVFQCKLYSKPVGNSAVQQIIAGREFEEADFAAVITNSSFTASAFQLASVANIDLIHYEEIDEYTQMILNKKN